MSDRRFGNPYGANRDTGRGAEQLVEESGEHVAGAVGMPLVDLAFTSSATGANNLAPWLLFESMPGALGYKPKMPSLQIKRFAKTLARSVSAYMHRLFFDATGVENRAKSSSVAREMEPSVTDRRIKVFLAAPGADTLERDEEWTNYVAMSLTDVPPMNWKDDDRELFEDNLRAASAKFKRMARMHFARISDSFIKPSYRVTVTRADGSERHDIVSLGPEQRKEMGRIASLVKRELKKSGFSDRDVAALVAILNSEDD